jgi:hypothetical protein
MSEETKTPETPPATEPAPVPAPGTAPAATPEPEPEVEAVEVEPHERVFVLGQNPYSAGRNPYTEATGYDHEPNKLETVAGAIAVGLRPVGEAAFKSAKKHADGASWALIYAVDVEVTPDDGDDEPTE